MHVVVAAQQSRRLTEVDRAVLGGFGGLAARRAEAVAELRVLSALVAVLHGVFELGHDLSFQLQSRGSGGHCTDQPNSQQHQLGEADVEPGDDRHHDHHEDDHHDRVGHQLVARGPEDLAHLGDALADETRRTTAPAARRAGVGARYESRSRATPLVHFVQLARTLVCAGATGLEPATAGFGDRCSTN